MRKRLPARNEIYAVLGIVVFVVHSWAVRGFLHEVPSFILYFKIGQILAVFAYMMGFALVESLLVTFGLGLLSFLLPAGWFKNGFIFKSFITVFVGAIAMLWLENTVMTFNNNFPPMDLLLTAAGITLGIWVVLLVIFHFFKPFQKAALFLSDRIGVFAYLYVPLGVIGMVVVLVRNLW
jgi:hypothetical protein